MERNTENTVELSLPGEFRTDCLTMVLSNLSGVDTLPALKELDASRLQLQVEVITVAGPGYCFGGIRLRIHHPDLEATVRVAFKLVA